VLLILDFPQFFKDWQRSAASQLGGLKPLPICTDSGLGERVVAFRVGRFS